MSLCHLVIVLSPRDGLMRPTISSSHLSSKPVRQRTVFIEVREFVSRKQRGSEIGNHMARRIREKPRTLVMQNSTKTCSKKPITAITAELERSQGFLKSLWMKKKAHPRVYFAQIAKLPTALYVVEQFFAARLRLLKCRRCAEFSAGYTDCIRT